MLKLKVMKIKIDSDSFDIIKNGSSIKSYRYPSKSSQENSLEDALDWLESSGREIEHVIYKEEGYYQVVVKEKEF